MPGSPDRARRRTPAPGGREGPGGSPGPRRSRASRSWPTSSGPNEQRLQRIEPRAPELPVMLEPAGRLPQRLGPETEPMLAPADAAAHQSGALQHLHVLRDPVKRDGESAREAANVDLAPRQDRED